LANKNQQVIKRAKNLGIAGGLLNIALIIIAVLFAQIMPLIGFIFINQKRKAASFLVWFGLIIITIITVIGIFSIGLLLAFGTILMWMSILIIRSYSKV